MTTFGGVIVFVALVVIIGIGGADEEAASRTPDLVSKALPANTHVRVEELGTMPGRLHGSQKSPYGIQLWQP